MPCQIQSNISGKQGYLRMNTDKVYMNNSSDTVIYFSVGFSQAHDHQVQNAGANASASEKWTKSGSG